mgnify:CR=1 FL=1
MKKNANNIIGNKTRHLLAYNRAEREDNMNDKQFQKVMNESIKEINGVPVIKECGEWYCNFEDYKQARNKQGRKWSEKSFCDWCDKYNLMPNG